MFLVTLCLGSGTVIVTFRGRMVILPLVLLADPFSHVTRTRPCVLGLLRIAADGGKPAFTRTHNW